jgi:Spy/CpxP family protein refolding chaperone
MVAALAVTVLAQPAAGGRRMGGQGMALRMGQGMGPGGGPMAALKLTAEQRQQLGAIVQAERETQRAALERVRPMRKQLHEMIFGGSGDQAATVALAGDIATIEATARIHLLRAAAAILTPEQRKIVVESGMQFPPPGPGGRRGGR